MKALTLHAEWEPKPEYKLTEREIATRKPRNGAMVWKNPRIRIDDTPDPTPKDDEVIIEVAAVGICGSDMHMYESSDDGYIIFPGLVTAPNILGHEFAGRVVEVGKDVADLKVGDLVAVEEIQWCGECTVCRRGFVNHCERRDEFGFTIPGAMAQYTAAKQKYCWKLDAVAERYGEDEALILGAMVEPTGVSYQAMFNRLQNWQPGNHVVIFGAGPIGLAAQALAMAAGAGTVITFDPSESRRNIAETMGADHVLDPIGMNLNETILDLTRGRGADYVVECAGVADQTLQVLDRCLAVNASLIDIGLGGKFPRLPIVTYKMQGVQYAGAIGHSGMGTFQNVIRMMAAGRIDTRPMVSARLPLDDGIAAFKRLESRDDAKIMLLPNAN